MQLLITGTNSFQTDSGNLSCKRSKAWKLLETTNLPDRASPAIRSVIFRGFSWKHLSGSRGTQSIYLHRSGPLLENGLDRLKNWYGRYGFPSFYSISISTVRVDGARVCLWRFSFLLSGWWWWIFLSSEGSAVILVPIARKYFIWIQEGFAAEPLRNDSGANFQWNFKRFGFRPESQSCRPKVGDTDQKSEIQPGRPPESEPNRPEKGPEWGLGAFTEPPPP